MLQANGYTYAVLITTQFSGGTWSPRLLFAWDISKVTSMGGMVRLWRLSAVSSDYIVVMF
jgi:hypothetical protein